MVETMSAIHGIDNFPFLHPIADAWKTIRDEYLSNEHLAEPWHEEYLHKGDWHVLKMILRGKEIIDPRMHMPKTFELIKQVPGVFIAGVSIMKGGAHIKPHVGYTTEVFRSHLCLIGDGQASLNVGGEVYHWSEGEMVVFDDTVRHSAHNPSPLDRVVLIVDFAKDGHLFH